MPLVRNTTTAAMTWKSGGTGQNDGHWEAVSFNDSKDYAVSGVLSIASGGTAYLPPFTYPNVATLLYVVAFVRAGSITLDIEQNGSGIGGLTGLAVDTTPTQFTPTSTTVAVGDEFAPVIDSVDDADGLSLSFVFGLNL